MSHYAAMRIKAIDTYALNGTPDNTSIALANRGNRRSQADVLSLETPVTELQWTLGNHDQTLAVNAKPHISMTVKENTLDLRRVEVNTKDTGLVTLQAATSLSYAEKTIAARTYIYITIDILAHRTEQDFPVGQDAHIDIGRHHTAIAIGQNATDAHDKHFIATLHNTHWLAQGLEILELAIGLHDNGVIKTRLPEASTTVFIDSAKILIVSFIGKVIDALKLVVFAYAEGSKTGGRCNNSTVGELRYGADARQDSIGKRIVNKTVCRLIITVKASVCSNPQLPVTVTQQTDNTAITY